MEYLLTLKMANAMFDEMENRKYSARLNPESKYSILKSSPQISLETLTAANCITDQRPLDDFRQAILPVGFSLIELATLTAG
jgi:hypothetical protein